MNCGVILYGPPASGKDTTTDALRSLSPEYQLFRRLKVGSGRMAQYRPTTIEYVKQLRSTGEIVWENRAYGSLYVVDLHSLHDRLAESRPIVHLGQVDAISAVRQATPSALWVIVDLHCPREVAEKRIVGRSTGDEQERLRVWDGTAQLCDADISVDTSTHSPDEIARRIHVACTRLNVQM